MANFTNCAREVEPGAWCAMGVGLVWGSCPYLSCGQHHRPIATNFSQSCRGGGNVQIVPALTLRPGGEKGRSLFGRVLGKLSR